MTKFDKSWKAGLSSLENRISDFDNFRTRSKKRLNLKI
jgi:hypothetical protein